MGVGGDGEGEVGKGEDRPAVHCPGAVEVVWLDLHPGPGPPRADLEKFDPAVTGKLVLGCKKLLDVVHTDSLFRP